MIIQSINFGWPTFGLIILYQTNYVLKIMEMPQKANIMATKK